MSDTNNLRTREIAMLFILVGSFGVFVGALMGWFAARRWRQGAAVKSAGGDSQADDAAFGSYLWDPHCSLNALNRCIIDHSNQIMDDEPLYLLAEHLRLLAQIGKSGGMAVPVQLQEWVGTLAALRHCTHAGSQLAACAVELPDSVKSIEVSPIGRALIPMLRGAGDVRQISVECSDVAFNDPLASGDTRMSELSLNLSIVPAAASASIMGGGEPLRVQVRCAARLVEASGPRVRSN
jgi:hypothetical protein